MSRTEERRRGWRGRRPAPRERLESLGIDYLVIVAGLLAVGAVSGAYYGVVIRRVPAYTPLQAQWLATLTSVVPAIVGFGLLDAGGGTVGKRRLGLEVVHDRSPLLGGMVRNVVKFAPWQVAHIGIIDGVYTEFESTVSRTLPAAAMIAAGGLTAMALGRRDGRHLGDFLAGTRVVRV